MRLFIGVGHAARAVAARRAALRARRACSSSTPRPRATRSSSTSPAPKPGAKGRPLPGSAEVRIARLRHRRPAGSLRAPTASRSSAAPTRPGCCSPRASASVAIRGSPLRGVFARDDAWLSTGDLFRRDDDGDYWLGRPRAGADPHRGRRWCPRCRSTTRSATSTRSTSPSPTACRARTANEIPVAAVTLRAGQELDAAELGAALAGLGADRRPAIVHVVDEIPVTTWYRPLTGAAARGGDPDRRARPRLRARPRHRRLPAAHGGQARAGRATRLTHRPGAASEGWL